MSHSVDMTEAEFLSSSTKAADPVLERGRLTASERPDSSPASLLVLGLGNDILTDDAVGLRVAQTVGESFADDARVAYEPVMEMGLALLDHMVGFREVVLVDSVQTGERQPGECQVFEASALGLSSATTPHFLGVGDTLALGRALGLEMPDRVIAVSVEVEDPYTLGTELTPSVQKALPQLVERVRAEVNKLLAAQPESLQS